MLVLVVGSNICPNQSVASALESCARLVPIGRSLGDDMGGH
jgi:hypothetical protein